MTKSKKKSVAAKAAKSKTQSKARVDFGEALTPCARHYAELIGNPYRRSHEACVPTFPTLPSQKFTTFSSGTFASQTSAGAAVQGYGYISYNPWASIMNDRVCVTATNAGTSATSFPTNTFSGVSNFYSNSPYDYAFFFDSGISDPLTPNIDSRARLVASGLRVKYNGKFVETGGRVAGLESPDHTSLNNNYGGYYLNQDYSTIVQNEESGQFDLGPNQWYCVEYNPTDPVEWTYREAGAMPTAADAGNILGFAFATATPGVSLMYEAYTHWELIGVKVRSKSRSHSDSMGFSAVQQALSYIPLRQPHLASSERQLLVREKSFANVVGKQLTEMLAPAASILKSVGPAAVGAIGTAIGGPAIGSAAAMAARMFTSQSSTSQQLMLEAAGHRG